jgi:hypothetical protein
MMSLKSFCHNSRKPDIAPPGSGFRWRSLAGAGAAMPV